jgi:hypothetical protein
MFNQASFDHITHLRRPSFEVGDEEWKWETKSDGEEKEAGR